LEEQRAIAVQLDTEGEKLSWLAQKAGRGVELMKEHRGALIAAAVTGKIDVRQVA
jgi:type I restriction enzyme S subunit